jgi:hypothetical protein
MLTNESGEGHADQVFLRGFDAKEGQDIEFSVGGVPINESGNLHGNGHADTHFIIPELVSSLRVVEGPFDPRQGNYAVAGSANYELGLAERGSTSNRLPNSSTSGIDSPICKQRVVSPIPTSVQVERQGGLLLRVDPRLLFVNLDFSALAPASDGNGYAFRDDSSDQPSENLFQNLIAAGPMYTFSWANELR